MKHLHDIEITIAPTKCAYDYIAEFIWDAEEGRTTWYTCQIHTYIHSEWGEVAEGGYVVASGYEDELVVTRIDNITFYRLIGDDEIEQTGTFTPTQPILDIWVSEITEALNNNIENYIN